MNKNPLAPTPEELIEFSGEHLYYEIDMLYGVSQLIKKGTTNLIIYNALLESFVLHTSVILDFFYKLPMNPREAKATDYIRDLEEWRKVLPSYDKYFIKFNKKRNREVMHLSYDRLKVAPDEKLWDFRRLNIQLRKIIDLFLEKADPRLLHPKIFQLKNKSF